MKNKRASGIEFEYKNIKKYYCSKCKKKDNCNVSAILCYKERKRYDNSNR